MQEIWSNGNVERCDAYLADTYTIHHDSGDPWDGLSLDIAGFKARVTLRSANNASIAFNRFKSNCLRCRCFIMSMSIMNWTDASMGAIVIGTRSPK